MKFFAKAIAIAFPFFMGINSLKAQALPNGFDAGDYADAIDLAFRYIRDSALATQNFTGQKGSYQRIMRTPEVGLCNLGEVYLRSDGVAIVSLRGTIAKPESWLENFYAAMIPAEGSLTINDSTTFNYKLSNLPKSYVHVGWTLGLAHLAPYITRTLDSLLQTGVTNIIVTGHSQGGALAFLTTSYLHYYYQAKYPALTIKSYCSAAPKPGNQNYAYDFDYITRDGYGFRIVNSADWVPESPYSIQTLNDMNPENPLANVDAALEKQNFFVRLYLKSIYKKMYKSTAKAMRTYKKYLGEKLDGRIKPTLPQYKPPEYAPSSLYATAGTPIILYADSAYYTRFPYDGKNVFIHHMSEPYKYLLKQYYGVGEVK